MKAKSERRRTFIGDQLSECRDKSGLYFMLGFQKVTIKALDIFVECLLNIIFLHLNIYIVYTICLIVILVTTFLGLPVKLGYSKNSMGLCI